MKTKIYRSLKKRTDRSLSYEQQIWSLRDEIYKWAKKFIIQNIKTATTPVVPIPLGLQDVVKIATTPDSCSPDYKI